MATTKLYLDLRGKAKDGKGSIIITLAHNLTTASIGTGIRLKPKEWDGKKAVKCSNADAINVSLANRKNEIDRAIIVHSMDADYGVITATELKRRIVEEESQETTSRSNPLLKDLFSDYMNTTMSSGTRSIYTYTWKKIESYAGSGIRINDVTYNWLLSFEKYLSKSQSTNGRSVYLRALRSICNYAIKIGVTNNYPFRKFSIKQEQTQKRCIPVEKLRELYYFECREAQVKYRDYFFLMFFLIGINAKDLFNAKKDAVSNGRLYYVREKTHTKYSVKIEPEAQVLLDKYKGDEYLVDVMERSITSYKWFLDNMDRDLGKIGPIVEEVVQDDLFAEKKTKMVLKPIIPGLTSYFARHSWATIAYQIGIPVDIISQALGHSMGNKTTLIYIKPDQKRVDEANRAVIDYLFNKNGAQEKIH